MGSLNNWSMPADVARHEVSHMLGAIVGWMGHDKNGLSHLCQSPRYHDAQCWIGFDHAGQQGEFSLILSKYSQHGGELSDDMIDAIRRSSALAPIGLHRDPVKVLRSLKTAKHAYDLVNDFSDVLSTEDRQLALKGSVTISRPEQLVGIFAFEAMKAVAPDRLAGIVKTVERHGGGGLTLPLREFVPRALGIEILGEAMKMSKTLFAIAKV